MSWHRAGFKTADQFAQSVAQALAHHGLPMARGGEFRFQAQESLEGTSCRRPVRRKVGWRTADLRMLRQNGEQRFLLQSHESVADDQNPITETEERDVAR